MLESSFRSIQAAGGWSMKRIQCIPSPAAMVHFSALAFLGAHKSHEFMKLRLSNLILMAESTERRSNRSRKPKVHFDDQILQSSKPSKPSSASKAVIISTKAAISSAKPSTKPSTKPSIEPSTSTELSTEPSTKLSTKPSTKPSTSGPIQQLCTQTEELDIEENEETASDKKAKKKVKAEEIARLSRERPGRRLVAFIGYRSDLSVGSWPSSHIARSRVRRAKNAYFFPQTLIIFFLSFV